VTTRGRPPIDPSSAAGWERRLGEEGGGRVSVAEIFGPLLRAVHGADLPIRLRDWDGSAVGPAQAPVRLSITSRRALRRLLWSPNELGRPCLRQR